MKWIGWITTFSILKFFELFFFSNLEKKKGDRKQKLFFFYSQTKKTTNLKLKSPVNSSLKKIINK